MSVFTALTIAAGPAVAAVNVAVYGFEYPQNLGAAVNTLNANGYNATSVGLADITVGLAGFDVLYVTHPYDGGGWSPGACNGVRNFLRAGKGVVLEWDASLLAFDSLGPNIYVNSVPQCALFVGTADHGQSVGFSTPIKITDAASPLVAGLTSPFAMGAASDYIYQVTSFDPALWKVGAAYTGWGFTNNAALMYARYQGAGCIAVGTMAFGDNGYSDMIDASSRRLFLDMIATVAPGPGACIGILPGSAVPALSQPLLLALFALIAASAFVLPRRAFRRTP